MKPLEVMQQEQVEVCAHLAITQKIMVSEPFWLNEGLQYGL